MLVRAAVVAAIVGFGAGWLVRMWMERTPESAARDTTHAVQQRVREATH